LEKDVKRKINKVSHCGNVESFDLVYAQIVVEILSINEIVFGEVAGDSGNVE
jgi:hypothetical protein